MSVIKEFLMVVFVIFIVMEIFFELYFCFVVIFESYFGLLVCMDDVGLMFKKK